MTDVIKVVITPPPAHKVTATTPGPQGPPGSAGVIPMGPWDVDTVYAQTHTVKYDGGMWWAKRANQGVTPVEGDDWTQLVEQGEQGPQGIQGPTGTVTGTATALVVLNGGGAPIEAGLHVDLVIDYDSTITGWHLLADTAGDLSLDVRKVTYAAFPPTGADSIVAAAPPTLVAAVKNTSTTLTGWDTAVTSGDILRVYVTSASLVERVSLTLTLNRT